VLSPSTASHDRGEKVPAYRTLGSVEEILIVSSTAQVAELWQRTEEGWTVADLIGPAVTIGLESIGVQLTLDEVFAGVAL